jgi:hypothetical protein
MADPELKLFRVEVKVVLYVLAECESVAQVIADGHFAEEDGRTATVSRATAEGLRQDCWAHTHPYARMRAAEICNHYLEKDG